VTFDGVVWRHVPAGAQPLHVGFILLARGRWNRQGVYGCLYTSLSRDGAIAEYHKELARTTGVSPEMDQRRDLVSIHAYVERVLDLSDAARRQRIGVSLEALTGDTPDDVEICRVVADLARLEGYEAILSPSAALTGGHNLNLYVDGLAANVRLADGPDRVPLNY
jgi:RES domain-containing protein